MNRLAGETSPYLLQHADNPVDWWPWGPEAFDEARRRDVPVLLSVGYASCHWCHVMARESFEDEALAGYLNAHFLSVKVDREERPDVDSVYMDAVQAATGQGGWPMTVFMTAEGEPFYFGTYFPPSPRAGLPSFRQLLEGVHTAWTDRRDEVAGVASRIARELAGRALEYGDARPPGAEDLAMAVGGLAGEFDAKHGGFGGAPKFPPSSALAFLLRHHARTGSADALRLAERTCDAMARGGIFDQLGGGFARYAVDAAWEVPHFEKMLYDNALLGRVYTQLWRITGTDWSRRIALETADFVVRELRTGEGGFASALDADSEAPGGGGHAEGAYYTWTPAQLTEALGPADAALAADVFGVGAEGTLRRPGAEPPAALRERLRAARERRPRPERDDKVVAAWNGLAIAALAETGACFDRADLVAAAVGAAELLCAVHLGANGRLARTSRDGRAGASAGVLEDYADVAEGFLALHAVTGERRWLDRAGALLDVVLARFASEDGALYDTADDAERLIRRPQDPTDGATPAGWTAAAGALLSYAAHTGSDRHRGAAERALGIVTALGTRAPRFIGWGLAVAEAALDGPREVAVVGPADDPATAELHRTALRATAPGAVVTRGAPDAADPPPLLAGRPLRDGRPTAYVCRGFVCAAPTNDPAELAAQLAPSGA
ncbi:thioredoxin domain-containing protein [Streptomyces radicis]|uniref:Thioredoxin domain-containing protein n=1 Tax=Streptomyces radicis TaxID=1750517 RepID=A0A3A9WIS4_9ACTN|nr:thioredoxin domain-containing protein [Streptomyces radicis]RKN07616.1 thioredoxin domain-containing protein [Streptomyces radicis]RKN18339.1 thioredoxin domain-containing protein [Streptomyces radicis]